MFFLFLALVFLDVFGSMGMAWYYGAILVYELGRDIFKWAGIRESTPQYEVFRSIMKYIRLAVWGSFIYFYAQFTSQKSSSKTALTATIPGVVASSIELVIDLFVSVGSSVEKVTFTLSKLWRVLLWITITILLSDSTIDRFSGEVWPSADKSSYLIWSFAVLTFFVCLAIYFLVKTIETAMALSKKEQLNGMFMLRASRYLCIHFWVVLISFAVCNWLVQQGLFAIKTTTKVTMCLIASVAYFSLGGLALVWRNEIKKLGELNWTEFNQLYPNCLTKRISNQVHQARLARISQSQIDPGQPDASVLAPVLDGSPAQTEGPRARQRSTSLRRVGLSPQPQLQLNDRPDPQDRADNQSLGSIRFIERKSSVIFNQITAKKIQALLQADGLLDDKKLKLARKQEKSPLDSKMRPKSAHREESASPEPKRQNSDTKQVPELQVMFERSSPAVQQEIESVPLDVQNSLLSDGQEGKVPVTNIVMGRDGPPAIMKAAVYERLKAVMKEDVPDGVNPPILPRSEHPKCLICEVNPSDCIIYPCYHSKVCFECCVQMLDWQHSKCHFCRGALKKIILIDASTSYNNIFKVTQIYTINYQDEDKLESEQSVRRAVEAIAEIERNQGLQLAEPSQPLFESSLMASAELSSERGSQSQDEPG